MAGFRLWSPGSSPLSMNTPVRILLILLAVLMPLMSVADRKNSISRKLKPSTSRQVGAECCAEPFDTVAADNTMVRFSGYEKTLRSNRETVFVTNLLGDREIAAVYFTITYFDSSGRLLHGSSRRHMCLPVKRAGPICLRGTASSRSIMPVRRRLGFRPFHTRLR